MRFRPLLIRLTALCCGFLLQTMSAHAAPKHILLRSAWQVINIGDIGHTPGILRLLQEQIPDAEVTLWPGQSIHGPVEEMLRRNFPKLRIVSTPEEVAQAFKECDFLLHSSGSGLVAKDSLAKWSKETGKPYGVYGISLPGAYAETLPVLDAETRDILTRSRFVFFRDSVSLQYAKDNGVASPVMDFAPDAAFGVALRNDAAADKFLAENHLQPGKYLCVIPRLRFTPMWEIHHRPMNDGSRQREAVNNALKEHDNAPLREAVIAVARQTDLKVLLCPEDESQMAVGKEMIFDKLPDDVKAKVVWREHFWLTDEAVSTYVKSAGLLSLEMHSPILCIANVVPAIVCRFKQQTTKGFMWRDIGLKEWLFDMDKPDEVTQIVPTTLALVTDPAAAKQKTAKAQAFIQQRQRETMKILETVLNQP